MPFVTLSACDTGLGAIEAGEGMFGLRRSFLVAGTRSLIVSLWEVKDEDAELMMRVFYERLAAGASRLQALQDARDALRERRDRLWRWGAFILLGDTGPMAMQAQWK